MTLVNRWYRILETLVSQNQLTFDDLRSQLDVSPQTLSKSIEQLNDVLDGDIEIRQTDNILQLQVYDYARLEHILAGSLRKTSDFNSASKRISYLLKRLLQSKTPLLMDDLAEEVGVSRGTITKDLKAAKDIAKNYDVTITGKPNRGIIVVGSELNLRLLYIHEVYNYFDPNELDTDSLAFLEELYHEYSLPRKIQELLTKSIAITVMRLANGHFLSDPILYYSNDVDSHEFMEKLVCHIELAYHISLSQYEKEFISFPLNTQYIEGMTYQEAPLQDKVMTLYLEMVTQVRDAMLVNFDQDKLFEAIQTHFKFLLNRLVFHVQTNDIFHGEIRNQYPLAFEMANVAGRVLSQHFGYTVELSERSYLALYFEMVVRDVGDAEESFSKKIAVVCTTGRGTANMICQRLMKVLGRDIIISQFSEEQFDPEENDNYFAIFTTVPLKFGHLKSPVVQITNLFDDQWLQNEWQKIYHYHQKNLTTTELLFMPLSKGKSYQDYLVEMLDNLDKRNLVDESFAARILERENLRTTVFSNHIAFPHAVNDKLGKTILMLGILDEPYDEHGHVVEFIFLVAISKQVDSQTEADLLELYDDIFRIAGDANLQEGLRQVTSQADLLSFTKEKGIF